MVDVAAVVLAAGRSSRYQAAGGVESSKLVASIEGKPLVRRVVEAALASRARPVVVVTGHADAAVREALAGLDVGFVTNPDFASGMASSLKRGVGALPDGLAGAVILLADMPAINAALIDRLIAAFGEHPDALAATPSHNGRRGNPALLAASLFADVAALAGDEGARRLLAAADPDRLVDVPMAGEAATLDVDTPQALDAAREAFRRRRDE